jgi:hypothetical protein
MIDEGMQAKMIFACLMSMNFEIIRRIRCVTKSIWEFGGTQNVI